MNAVASSFTAMPAGAANRGQSRDVLLTDAELQLFQEFMYQECGVRLPNAKRSLIQARLQKRLYACGLPTFTAYHQYILAPQHSHERRECTRSTHH